MKALGYNLHVAIQIALVGNAPDMLKEYKPTAKKDEQFLIIFIRFRLSLRYCVTKSYLLLREQ